MYVLMFDCRLVAVRLYSGSVVVRLSFGCSSVVTVLRERSSSFHSQHSHSDSDTNKRGNALEERETAAVKTY